MKKRMPLATRILWGLVVGVVAAVVTLGIGQLHPPVLEFMRKVSTNVFDPFGQVFLRLLFFVVIPLVFASLAGGVAQLGRLNQLGPLAARTFGLFFLNMVVGVGIGLLMMNTLQPGLHMDPSTTDQLLAQYGSAQQAIPAQAAQEKMGLSVLVEMFMPRNIVGAVAGSSRDGLGDVLPLILFALLFGAATTQIAVERRKLVIDSLDALSEIMMRIVHYALLLAPFAVPAMIYSVIVKVGLDVLLALSLFVLGCALALALHLFGTMSLWIRFMTKFSPWRFFGIIRPVLITAFSTSSSNATLPTSLTCATEDLKLRQSTAGFVLPLGATMNMSGTALYEGCVVLFIAQIFGVDLSLSQQVVLMFLSVLSAVAVAGIPGGSLPLIAGLLATFGVPPEGIGIIIGVDRVLDMMRTTVNVGADIVTATIVDERMVDVTAVGSE